MKKKLVSLTLLYALLVCFGTYSQTNTQETNSSGKLKRVLEPKRPRIPSNVFIEYIYTGSGISFLPSEYYVTLEVTVTSMETTEIWTATVSEPEGYYMETGALSQGTYSIFATTEVGAQFYGEFQL